MRGVSCCVEPVLGNTLSINAETSWSSGGSSKVGDDDTANITSEIISKNNKLQEFLAFSLLLK